MEKWDYCGQGHREGSKCRRMFVQMIFSLSVHSVSPELLNHFFFTKRGMVVYYHEAICHAEKLVHYLECQGHS